MSKFEGSEWHANLHENCMQVELKSLNVSKEVNTLCYAISFLFHFVYESAYFEELMLPHMFSLFLD